LLCLIIYSSFYFIVNWCVVICLRFVTAIVFCMNCVFYVVFVGMLVLTWIVINQSFDAYMYSWLLALFNENALWLSQTMLWVSYTKYVWFGNISLLDKP
jgi:hypothetical protein